MSTRTEQRKTDRIDKVVDHLRERWEDEPHAVPESFVRHFYRGVPPADVVDAPVEALYGSVVGIWRFLERRSPREAKVRVYDPSLEEHGWTAPLTVIEIVNDDMPFLVDSVAAEIHEQAIEIQRVVHPVFGVKRADDGRLLKISTRVQGRDGLLPESVIQIHVHKVPSETFEPIRTALERVLGMVRATVRDWRPMTTRCRELATELREGGEAEQQESAAFLEWLLDDHFTWVGYREYAWIHEGEITKGAVIPDSGLGAFDDEAVRVFGGRLTSGALPPDVIHYLSEPEPIKITKANLRSPVHRPVLLDIIAVKRRDEDGQVTASCVFAGLFTSLAYSATPMQIPILRWKVTRTLSKAHLGPNTHDGRALLHILTSFPRDALYQISEDALVPTALGILDLQERPRTALFARVDPFERNVSCLVYTPRDAFDTALRFRIQAILTKAWNGRLAAYNTLVDEAPLARLHLSIATTPGQVPDVDLAELEEQLTEAGRTWQDRLLDALVSEHGLEGGETLFRRYGRAFPAAYRDVFHEQEAVADIHYVEEALEGDGLALNLYHPPEAPPHILRFKVYAEGQPVPLSDVLPMLENMGFTVVAEEPYRLRIPGRDHPTWIRDLSLKSARKDAVDLKRGRGPFHEAFREVWNGKLQNDGFNRLVLLAGLSARQVVVLRAYCRYLLQARIPFSQAYIEQTLADEPTIARRLVELFEVRFDVDRREGAEANAAAIVDEVHDLLDAVLNLDMDRIIRRYLEAIGATLRTNYYRRDDAGNPLPYLSFKLASAEIATLPLPRPYREIFVYSPRMEGIHLRGGTVARGGLRWSDRPEDFRTEILGLMKAQQVKNTVIVPVGSKGGFVLKRPPPPEAGREALMEEVVHSYRTLIRGLLDLTDNLDGDGIVAPERVVRWDDDDPYLVVAADKGTATFSDIANGVSAEYGFWLDDAFASGGSAGYDHKKMGITARGAWECVKRHFRELGKDIQSEDFTVAGIGDMSGDVFGNGMLLSKHIRLVGAFNHEHVFLDPDPDAVAAFEERRRLFDLPRSSWAEYDASTISEGGGIWARDLKSIPLSPEVRALLQLEGDEVTPNELIHAMLQAPVELLWFGGIGTYVKASDETNPDAGDRANDAVRVDGRHLRAKVVGEGANLALTQRGRIEAALGGVRLNTDALDNSAGVDCSDHEVNIKILLGEAERAGDLTRKRRDQILGEMTDEVARLVLRDNYLQSQAITVAQHQGASGLDRIGRFMRALEKRGQLNREIEFLPDDPTLARRINDRIGLTRPEISVLLAYAKLVLYDELLPSTLPDEPWMADELLRYFPVPLRETYAEPIRAHRLHREIQITMVTNAMLNRVGLTFVHEMKERTGLPAEAVARAYIVARDVLDLPPLYGRIEELDNVVSASLQAEMLAEAAQVVEQVVVWMLRELPGPIDVPGAVTTYRGGVRELTEDLDALLPASHRIACDRHAAAFISRGAPEDLAHRVARFEALVPGCDIVRIARNADISVGRTAEVYYATGEAFGFDWLQGAAADLPKDSAWDKLAISSVVVDLYQHQAAVASSILETAAKDESAAQSLERWSAARAPLMERTRRLFGELGAVPRPSLAMLAVAVQQVKTLAS